MSHRELRRATKQHDQETSMATMRLRIMTNTIDESVGRALLNFSENPMYTKIGDNEWLVSRAEGVTL